MSPIKIDNIGTAPTLTVPSMRAARGRRTDVIVSVAEGPFNPIPPFALEVPTGGFGPLAAKGDTAVAHLQADRLRPN
jgi:hypothetical protein